MKEGRNLYAIQEEPDRWIILVFTSRKDDLNVEVSILRDDYRYAFVFKTRDLAQRYIDWIQK